MLLENISMDVLFTEKTNKFFHNKIVSGLSFT